MISYKFIEQNEQLDKLLITQKGAKNTAKNLLIIKPIIRTTKTGMEIRHCTNIYFNRLCTIFFLLNVQVIAGELSEKINSNSTTIITYVEKES